MGKDALTLFIEFLNKTAGRDRLCRLIQFACRTSLGVLDQEKFLISVQVAEKLAKDAPKDAKPKIVTKVVNKYFPWIDTFEKVMSAMVMCRKLLRFGKTAIVYRNISKHAAEMSSNPQAALQQIARFCELMFYVTDHLIWANMVGLVTFDAVRFRSIERWSYLFWLAEATLLIVYHLNRLSEITKQLVHVNASSEEGIKLRAEQRTAICSLVKNAVDVPVVWHFLGVQTPFKVSLLASGIFGMIGSVIGIYEVWPSS